MTFSRISLVLLGAFVTPLLMNTAIANSVSSISVHQNQRKPIIDSGGSFTPLMSADCCDGLYGGQTESETIPPFLQGIASGPFGSALNFDEEGTNAASVHTGLQSHALRHTNSSGAEGYTYPVAEPGTLTLFGSGLVFLAGMIRSKFTKA